VAVAPAAEQEFAAALAEAQAFWESLLAGGMRIRTPEPRVNNGYRVWQALNFLNMRKLDKDGKGRIIHVPYDGAGFYNELYGISGVTDILACMLAGQFDAARECCRGVLAYQRDDGLFHERYGLCDNGILLVALSQYYLLTGDRDSWQEFLPAMQRLATGPAPIATSTPGTGAPSSTAILPPGNSRPTSRRRRTAI